MMYPTSPVYLNNAMARQSYRANNLRTVSPQGFYPALLQYGSEAKNVVANAGTDFAHAMGTGFSGLGADAPTVTPVKSWYEDPAYLIPLGAAAVLGYLFFVK